MAEIPLISVVIPVKNEALLLEHCLASLRSLAYPADRFEVIVADAQSRDNTKEVAEKNGARVVENHKQIVVSGRNRGFEHARGELVAFTDADCIFDTQWLTNCLKYFEDGKVAGVGGPTFMPQDSTHFEQAVNFLFALAGMMGVTSHRQAFVEAHETFDIPGCNAIYRRRVLEEVMPVDEGLLTAEDVWMNEQIRARGYKFIMAPDVILWHYRRSSPLKFMRQIYRFAIGRFQVGKRKPGLLKPLHIAAALTIPFLLALELTLRFTAAMWLYPVLAMLFVFDCFFLAFLHTRKWSAAFYFPFVVLIFCCFWSLGALRELFFPLRDPAGR